MRSAEIKKSIDRKMNKEFMEKFAEDNEYNLDYEKYIIEKFY